MMDVDRDDAGGGTGSARRRRERRLRHERMAVAMALSKFKHHSSRGQRKDRAGGEVRVEPHGGLLEAPLPQGGSRPPCLGVPRGPHVGLERHFLEHMADICPFVQILDAPVPQPVENVTDTLRIPGPPDCRAGYCSAPPSRSLVPEPQSADLLVEVPTVLSPLRVAEQIVGIPVPRGRVQGFLPVQSSTASPSSLERISEQVVEQIVDISPGGGLGQGSSSSAGPADEDVTGVFRTFPQITKSAKLASHSSLRATPATFSTVWKPPLGVKVVWVGERNEEGGVWYWHRDTRVSTFDLPPLPPGRGAVPPAKGGIQILGSEPSLLCRDLLHREQWSLVFLSTWHTACVGSDHFGTAHTGSWVYALFCAVWTTINSLSVSLVVMVSQVS